MNLRSNLWKEAKRSQSVTTRDGREFIATHTRFSKKRGRRETEGFRVFPTGAPLSDEGPREGIYVYRTRTSQHPARG